MYQREHSYIYIERRRQRLNQHNYDISIGLPGDQKIIEQLRKRSEAEKIKRDSTPKKQRSRTPGSFPKGNISYNKLTPEQKLASAERTKERLKNYYADPVIKEKVRQYGKAYNLKNRERINKQQLAKIKANPELALLGRLRKRLHKVFKLNCIKKSNRTLDLLGCDIHFFKTYIGSKFTEGMSFDNYGAWHLDHITPCVCFDFSKPEDVAKCFHYTNFQPLWALDNLKKGTKILTMEAA